MLHHKDWFQDGEWYSGRSENGPTNSATCMASSQPYVPFYVLMALEKRPIAFKWPPDVTIGFPENGKSASVL